MGAAPRPCVLCIKLMEELAVKLDIFDDDPGLPACAETERGYGERYVVESSRWLMTAKINQGSMENPRTRSA